MLFFSRNFFLERQVLFFVRLGSEEQEGLEQKEAKRGVTFWTVEAFSYLKLMGRVGSGSIKAFVMMDGGRVTILGCQGLLRT